MTAIVVVAAGCDLLTGQPRSVYIVGDSIVADAAWNEDARFTSPAPPGYAVEVDAFMGQTVADHVDAVRRYAAQGVPERLAIELGTNDARDGGWTDADTAAYQQLVDLAPDRTCITFVLPHAGPGAPLAERTAIAEASSAIRAIAAKEPRHQIADFADFHAAFPSAISADGIHLRTTGPDARWVKDTFRDWLWEPIDRCVGGSP